MVRRPLTTDEAIAELPLLAWARRSDPPTSRQAASVSPVSGHCRQILEALASGPAGKTEIGRRCGLTEQQVARRMHGLRAAGRVDLTGSEATSASGCAEAEYRLTR